ncbi:MAG: DUF3311 domain-containing protein [Chthoniobacteraceae bacterium]
MNEARFRFRQKLMWWGVLALVLLHHDFWWWSDPTLVLGFLPIGLAYHMAFSVAASALWLFTVKFAWPTHLEEFANGGQPATQPNQSARQP